MTYFEFIERLLHYDYIVLKAEGTVTIAEQSLIPGIRSYLRAYKKDMVLRDADSGDRLVPSRVRESKDESALIIGISGSHIGVEFYYRADLVLLVGHEHIYVKKDAKRKMAGMEIETTLLLRMLKLMQVRGYMEHMQKS